MSDTHRAGEQASYSLDWLRRQQPETRREVLEELTDRGDEAAIGLLVACLSDDHPGVQQKAVNGLIRIGGDRVLRQVVGLLREPPGLRMMATEILGHVAPASVECLRPALESPDPSVRKLIIDAIGRQSGTQAGAWLLSMLSDPDANVRAAAAEALGSLHLREAVPGLVALLNDDDWVVYFAASALAEIGDESAIPALMAVISRGHTATTCAALEAVGKLDHEGRTIPALADLLTSTDRAILSALVRALVSMAKAKGAGVWSSLDRTRWLETLSEMVRDEERATRSAAVRGLGLLGNRRGTRPILSAYRAMKDPTDEETDQTIRALTETGDTDVLIKAAELDEDRVSDAAIQALGHLQCREAVNALDGIRRRSWDWRRRKVALGALAQIGTDQAFAMVCEGIEDATGYVRAEAVRLISESGRTGYVRRILTRLQSERYEDVRLEMAKALLRAGTQEVMIELVGLLRYGGAPVRETAAWAIGAVQLPEGLDPLVKTFNDPEWQVRRAVVESLSRYQDEQALHVLLVALTDDHEKVRLAATTGIASWERPEARRALLNVSRHDPDVWVRRCAIERLGNARIGEAVPHLSALAVDRSAPKLLRHAAVDALCRIGGADAEAAVSAAGSDGIRSQNSSAA
jgi:HEAT repeat protein